MTHPDLGELRRHHEVRSYVLGFRRLGRVQSLLGFMELLLHLLALPRERLDIVFVCA